MLVNARASKRPSRPRTPAPTRRPLSPPSVQNRASGWRVHAAVPVATWPAELTGPSGHDVSIVDLPEVENAAAIIHHGSMDDVLPTGQALARWIDANGYRSAGYAREITLNWSPDPEQWVTELQQPIDKSGG